MYHSKRSRAALARLLSLATILAVGIACVAATPARAADQPPIKVGFISSLSGYFAAPGKYMEEGLKLYLQEHNDTIAGRKIVLDIADDQGNPAVGLTQLRRLVEQDHVDVIFGPLSAAVGSAMATYLDSHKTPAVYPIVSSDDLTQRTPAAYVVRTGWTSSQTTQPLGDYAYKTLKYRKVATIAYDFSFGWESIGGSVAAFQDDGGKVVKQIWTPLSTTDFSPYLSELPRDVDAIMCSYSGSQAVNFMKQYKAFGLKIPLICQGNSTDESTLQTTGSAALGIVTALQYSAALDTAANKKFVAAYTKAYGHGPSYYGEGTYVGAMVLAGGIEALHGNISDPTTFVKAMRSVNLTNAPRGPIGFDSYGNPVQNVYIRKVEEVGGQLANVVIHTDHNVSQFWTYDPAAFLRHPVYSRSYPPCNDCK
ncbi:ABC transporter substrate-binding protein [bacterium]|nr:MAG: ABC transporter substrate-binding protein [bacterium]